MNTTFEELREKLKEYNDLKEKLFPPKKPRFFAVEYAGFWIIQKGSDKYDEGLNILSADDVGKEFAKNNAELIVKMLNAIE